MRYVVFIIVTLLLSCQDIKKADKPVNLISKDKMVDIFVDSYLSNAARSVDNKTIRDKGIKLDSFIYGKHGIDSLQFAQSNAYYTNDLDSYKDLFLKVEQRLIVLQEKDSENTEVETIQDSIKKGGIVTRPQINQEEASIK